MTTHHLIGRRIGKYELTNFLGAGGNADVFIVEERNGKKYAMKLLKVSNDRRFNKKYQRFKDEIKVVIENQQDISGIIPIFDKYLPDKPTPHNRPWYTMPIATPIYEVFGNEISVENVISCVKDLSETLSILHSKNIVHRDIKPSNIYKLNDKWAFGDFGLVEYPEKVDFTEKGESVGPRNTIAPEMKRNASEADGKPADIYSLAKTLWILLTKVRDGFDGQYSHKEAVLSLDTYVNKGKRHKTFLVTLHKLLKDCTSNAPEERPDITTFGCSLVKTLEISKDFKKRNMVEWEFLIREIIPYTLPENVSWTNISDIQLVLSLISNLNLNHLFFPDGGGNDLVECKISKLNGYIELNFGYGPLLIKPKRLTLCTFQASFDWNCFYLETEEVDITELNLIDVNVEGIEEEYDLPLLELTPGTYIEEWHGNYGTFNDEPLPSSARDIRLGLKGNYLIVAKGSVYNSIASTYDGRHNKMDPTEFRNYLQMLIDTIKFYEEKPEIAKYESEKRERMNKIKEEEERKKYIELSEEFGIRWDQHLNEFTMPKFDEEQVLDSGVLYGLTYYEMLNDRYYFFSKDNKLIKYATGWLEEYESEFDCFQNGLIFNSFEKLIQYINQFMNNVVKIEGFEDWVINHYVSIYSKRLKKPEHLFTKVELEECLRNANDKTSNIVCINFKGYLEIIPFKNLKEEQLSKYAVKGFRYSAYQNSVGKTAILDDVEEQYLILLYHWKNHLELNKTINLSDDYRLREYNEDEIINDIRELEKNYR